MKRDTVKNSLVKVNENSIFYKIKMLFKNLFHRNVAISDNYSNIEEKDLAKNENKKYVFLEDIRNIENEETKLLKLQKQYRNGEIKEEDLTVQQINSLCQLYDKQIANLKKSNEIRKQRLLEYRKNLQTNE